MPKLTANECQFDVDRESSAEKELAERIRRLVPDLEPRLVPSVQLVPPKWVKEEEVGAADWEQRKHHQARHSGTTQGLSPQQVGRGASRASTVSAGSPSVHLLVLCSHSPRPYLHLHPDMNKRETQIINVAHASVVASPDVEMLLGVSLTLPPRGTMPHPGNAASCASVGPAPGTCGCTLTVSGGLRLLYLRRPTRTLSRRRRSASSTTG